MKTSKLGVIGVILMAFFLSYSDIWILMLLVIFSFYLLVIICYLLLITYYLLLTSYYICH